MLRASFSMLIAYRHEIGGNLTIELYPFRNKGPTVAKQGSPEIVVNVDFDVESLIAVFVPLTHVGDT